MSRQTFLRKFHMRARSKVKRDPVAKKYRKRGKGMGDYAVKHMTLGRVGESLRQAATGKGAGRKMQHGFLATVTPFRKRK